MSKLCLKIKIASEELMMIKTEIVNTELPLIFFFFEKKNHNKFTIVNFKNNLYFAKKIVFSIG